MPNLDSNDTGNLIYLIALLAFLCSGFIFKGKIKTSKILKDLFIWFTIILFIVVLYSYRFQFIDIKNRLTGELFPSSATRISNNKIVINISDNDHYYVILKINNKKVRFMIDTGASDMVLNQDDAKNIGIDLNNLSFNRVYQTANGSTYGASVRLNQVEIAGVIFKDVPASVNQSDMGTSLLGMSFLRNFRKYEFYQDKLILTF